MFARSMLHPRLKKPMRLVDHLHFAAEHDDHHLAKIWDLITKQLGGLEAGEGWACALPPANPRL
jgi:hypothetical protein